MTHHVERVRRGSVASEHIVQLFDDSESLVRGVGAFLAEAGHAGGNLLVLATPAHWTGIAAELAHAGLDLDALGRDGRLTVPGMQATLEAFMRQGEPVRALFDEVIGELVRRLAVRPLRVYGEMVDVFAAEANFDAVDSLEGFWNELAEQCSFSLLCGYSSVHFGPEKSAGALRSICRAHTRTACHEADDLGSWLLAANGLRQPA